MEAKIEFYILSMKISVNTLMNESGVSFGTSGARGLVTAMTDKVCYIYTRAFIQHCEATYQSEHHIAIAGDLRPSTERILASLVAAANDAHWKITYCGRIPSPAIALYGITHSIPTIMVTGSHIPEDRNGIKFNHPQGEISKKDETGIRAQNVDVDENIFDAQGMFRTPQTLPVEVSTAADEYEQRYIEFFGPCALSGLTLGVYQHSAVGRDIIVHILEALGAFVKPLGRSDKFIPVDTEAIRPEDIKLAHEWAIQGYDAIVSTDGDSDRPLLADDSGEWFRGDVLGILAARALKISRVATPVSCNTALEKCEVFEKTCRTRIGSPYVIEGMIQLCENEKTVAGYEANGGFLLQTDIERNGKVLKALPTRDALLPIIAVLAEARELRRNVADLLRHLPKRFTASDRIKNFPTEKSKAKVEWIQQNGNAEILFGSIAGKLVSTDSTDGFRMEFDSHEIIHLRPSGNAPELRCYVEADSCERAEELKKATLALMENWKV
jgi:phosphomannomutase